MSAAETAPRKGGWARRWSRRWSRSREARWGVGLTSIWLVGFLAFAAVPLAMSVYISFTDWAPISGPFWDADTIGLKNYQTFLTDHVYWHSVFNTIYYAVGSVGVVNLVALPMALLLNQALRGLNFFRTVFYMPAILPAVAVVLVFRLILFPGTGLISWILTKVGAQCDTSQVTCDPVDWLNNPRLTMPAVILISAWGVGATLLIYLAGLQGIDQALYEAGAVDGTRSWSQFRYITLPLLTPAIFFNIIVGLIGAFQEFTKLVIFAGGATATGGPQQSLLTTFWYVYVEGFDLLPHGTGNRYGLRSFCPHPHLHGAELSRPETVGVLSGGASLMSTGLEQTPPVAATALPDGVLKPTRRRPVLPARGFGSKLAAYVVVVLISIVSLFPLYWMVENSLRTAVDAGANVTLVPKMPLQWSNYSTMWNYLPYPMSTFLVNSFVLAGLVTLGTVISSALIAYGFARFRFPGRQVLFAVIISTMMIPYAVMMIPQYALFINFFHWGSGGSLFGYHNLFQFLPQIVPAFFGSPIFIFLLRQFIRGIPYSLDEAAMVDGAGPLRIFWTIILPELRPALAAVAVLTFIGKWNDFLGPLIYLQDPHNWTMELALNGFVGRYGTSYLNLQMAASVIAIAPIVFVYFIASRQIIQGVTLSGVKG